MSDDQAINIVVIGGGPAGMMAAYTAAGLGARVTLLEKNQRTGRKLGITGKGRCNITNNCTVEELIRNTAVNPRFLYSAFSGFTPSDTMSFFEGEGVALKTERGNRVFPVSDKAIDINDAMVRACRRSGVKLLTGVEVDGIKTEDGGVVSVTAGGRVFPCDACVIATGGASYPLTGSTGDGYRFARELGHRITPICPSLVPLETVEGGCRDMMGLSLKNISIKVLSPDGKTLYEDFGELLFTHFGLSGPVILSASSHMRKPSGCVVEIDLKPALSMEKLDARVVRDLTERQNSDLGNALGGLLPKSMIPIMLRRWDMPSDHKANSVTREQRHRLCELIKHFRLTVKGFRPIAEAIITSGGVDVKDIAPKTMQSKLVSGLYFAGEVIDADAHTGGFNLQIALSTGYAAGKAAAGC